MQQGRDSDGFLVGAHLAAALWVEKLPPDISWRETAIARHRDIVQWLVPRIALSPEVVAHTVAEAAGFTDAAEQRLVRLIRPAGRQDSESRR